MGTLSSGPVSGAVFCLFFCDNVQRNRLLTLALGSFSFSGGAIDVAGGCIQLGGRSLVRAPGAPGDGQAVALPTRVVRVVGSCDSVLCSCGPAGELFSYAGGFLRERVMENYGLSKIGGVEVRSLQRSRTSLLVRLNFTPLLVSRELKRRGVRAALGACSRLCPGGRNRITRVLSGLVRG